MFQREMTVRGIHGKYAPKLRDLMASGCSLSAIHSNGKDPSIADR